MSPARSSTAARHPTRTDFARSSGVSPPSPYSTATGMYAIQFSRVYDTGRKIDLEALESAPAPALVRAGQSDVDLDRAPAPPARLPPVATTVDGASHVLAAIARIYEIGAISLCFILEDPAAPPSAFLLVSLSFSGQRGLDQAYLDPVALPAGEEVAFSGATREDLLRNSLSYAVDDRAVLAWDAALLIAPEPPADLVEVIEYAVVQAFELRYYDRALTLQKQRMYNDIEAADRCRPLPPPAGVPPPPEPAHDDRRRGLRGGRRDREPYLDHGGRLPRPGLRDPPPRAQGRPLADLGRPEDRRGSGELPGAPGRGEPRARQLSRVGDHRADCVRVRVRDPGAFRA